MCQDICPIDVLRPFDIVADFSYSKRRATLEAVQCTELTHTAKDSQLGDLELG